MTGTALGQVAAFVAAPILSRLYSPDDFGVVGVFLSIATVLGVIAALRLELAIVVPKLDKDAESIVVAALVVVSITVLLTAILVAVAARPISYVLGVPDLAPLLGVLPLYVGSLGVFQVFNYWATRIGSFGRLASAHITRGTATAAGQVGLGAVRLGAPGMLAGQVFGQFMSTLILLGRSTTDGRLRFRTPVILSNCTKLLRQYSDFTIFGSSQALLYAIGQSIPAILLTSSFGAATAGQYLLAHRVITAPSTLIGQSLRQVLYPQLSRQLHEPTVLGLTLKITLVLGVLASIPLALLAFFGPIAFTWAFGPNWLMAGQFARFLGIVLASNLANIPAVSLVPLLRIQRWHAGYEATYMIARSAALVLGGVMWGPVGAVAGLALTGLLFNFLLILNVLVRLRTHVRALDG